MHSDFFFGLSFPFYYPTFYSYSYPPAYSYGGYYDPPPVPPASYPAPSYPSDSSYGGSSQQPYRDQAASTYYQSGRDWGQDLRRDVVTWDLFVAYLRENIVGAASPAEMKEFRQGFGAGYGNHADEALDKAVQQAGEQPSTPAKTPSKEFHPRY